MRGRIAPWVVLLCGLPALAHATLFSGERRLEALPGETWMRGPSARLRLAAGAPVAFTPCSQVWVEGTGWLGSRCLLWAMAGQTNAGAYSEKDLGLGLRAGGESITIQARVCRQGRQVEPIASESAMRGELALVAKMSRVRIGLAQQYPLGSYWDELPSITSYAVCVTGEFWSASLLREDSPFEAQGIWRAGLRVTLMPLALAFKGDPDGGSFQLVVGHTPFNLRLALPVASSIEAGPYLGLEFGGEEGRARR